MSEIHRRKLLFGLGALIAAPAVARCASLMPVRGIVMPIKPCTYYLSYSSGFTVFNRSASWDDVIEKARNVCRDVGSNVDIYGSDRVAHILRLTPINTFAWFEDARP